MPGTLNNDEAEEWRKAAVQAKADGTFFVAQPFHCAVETKPEWKLNNKKGPSSLQTIGKPASDLLT